MGEVATPGLPGARRPVRPNSARKLVAAGHRRICSRLRRAVWTKLSIPRTRPSPSRAACTTGARRSETVVRATPSFFLVGWGVFCFLFFCFLFFVFCFCFLFFVCSFVGPIDRVGSFRFVSLVSKKTNTAWRIRTSIYRQSQRRRSNHLS